VSSDDYNVDELARALKILLDEMNKSRLMEIRLPKETAQELEDLSRNRDESVEILIKEAIIKYLEGETGTGISANVDGEEKTLLIGLDADEPSIKDMDEGTQEPEDDMSDIDEDYLISHGYSEVEAKDDVIGLKKSLPISKFKEEDDLIEGIGPFDDSEIIDRDDADLDDDEFEDEDESYALEDDDFKDEIEEVEVEIGEGLVEVVEDVELPEDDEDSDEVEVDGEVIEIVNDADKKADISSSEFDDLEIGSENLDVNIDDEISEEAEDLEDVEDADKETYDELLDLEEEGKEPPKMASIEEEILKALEDKENAETADQEETAKQKTSKKKKKGGTKTKKKGKGGSSSRNSQTKKKSKKRKGNK
jgi:hypothetical protein